MKPELLLTCEHGGNRVPQSLHAEFASAARALASHEGWDPGALEIARQFARALGAPLLACTTSRLVVDTNRSLDHVSVFSKWTRSLPDAEREALVAAWWQPHRSKVEAFVAKRANQRRPVLHISVHSFTPTWNGRKRSVDIGFLCDPTRSAELEFVERWRAALAPRVPRLRLRRNLPYRGTSDGLTTSMRRRFGGRLYAGVELEVNQRFPQGAAARWRKLRGDLVKSLGEALDLPG